MVELGGTAVISRSTLESSVDLVFLGLKSPHVASALVCLDMGLSAEDN
jgi:hypothetical protein